METGIIVQGATYLIGFIGGWFVSAQMNRVTRAVEKIAARTDQEEPK